MVEAVLRFSRAGSGARLTTMQRSLFWLLLFSLLPLALGAAVVLWQQFERDRDDAERNLGAAAASAAAAIDFELAAGIAELRVLAQSPLIDRADWITFHRLVSSVVAERDGAHISLVDRQGQMVISTTRPFGEALSNLWSLEGHMASWEGIEMPLGSQAFSRRVFQSGTATASRLYLGISVGRPAISIGMPVHRDGDMPYALLLSFSVATFAEALALPRADASTRLLLVDAEDRVILGIGPDAPASGSHLPADLTSRDAAMEEVFLHAVARPASAEWRVIASTPRRAAFAAATDSARAWSAFFLMALLGGGLLAAVLSRKITAPFSRLAEATRAALHGDTPPLPATRFVEIDALARALVDVASIDRKRRAEIEARSQAEQRETHALQTAALARQAEHRLRQLIDNLYAFVGVLDLEGRVTEVNRAPLDAAGIGREDVVGRAFWECPWWNYDPSIADRVRRAVEAAAAGESVRFDHPARMAGGAIAMVDLQIEPLHDEHGRIVGLIPSGVDVSDRIEAVKALRDSEQRFRAMANQMSQLAWICDSAGRALWYNRRWHEYVGEADADERTAEWQRHIHPDYRSRVLASFERCAATGEPWEETYPLRARSGDYRWFLSRAEPFADASGSVVRWFGTNTDITEQRATEHALRDSEQRLIENEAKLREADRQKDKFIATLAHELRNPLAPILTSAEIIGMHAVAGSHVARAQQAIQRQARHMARLVDDLLDVSRLKHDLLTLERRPVALAEVIAATLESARPGIDTAGHVLELELDPAPMTVDADLMRLAQALLNIVNNAVKFSSPGSTIRVRSRREGGSVRIDIADHGIGIAPDMLERVFDIFVQEGRSGVGGRSGLGIGLALSRSLVKMHGGQISVTSGGHGHGSTFTVRLPLADAVDAGAENDRRTRGGRPRRILVVDDNVDAAEALGTMLSLLGHTTHVAHDGGSALRLHAEHRPEVTVLDIGLPDISGYDVARRLRSTYGDDCGVLIALTGWGQEADKQRAQSLGFRCHLTKPAHPDRIVELLAALD